MKKRAHLGALVLAAACIVLLPSTASWAWRLVCDGGYLVYECNDGTRIRCISSEGGVDYQIDCPDSDAIGADLCIGHGGYFGVVPGPDEELVCQYDGELPMRPFTDGDADPDGDASVNSTCTAAWSATCRNGETVSCDENRQSCPADAYEKRCKQQGGVQSSTLFAAFTPSSNLR